MFDELNRMGACWDALRWVQQFVDPVEAWQACNRADWMAWILEMLGYTEGFTEPGPDCGCPGCALDGFTPDEIRELIPMPI